MVKGILDEKVSNRLEQIGCDLLKSIGHLLKRFEIYTEISPTEAMNEMIVKILVELLSTLAFTTKETKQGRLSGSIVGEGVHCLTYERRKT